MSIQISATVCTHNRSAYLKKAMQSLADQTLPREQYEVIVVDNGSTDDTRTVVESCDSLHNVRYIYEPILGLSQARNTGWQNARGQYTAYMDDDAVACPEWLERIVAAFESVQPRPGSVGGRVMPIWEAERPAWLPKELEPPLTIIDWVDKPTFLKEGYQFLAGTNVAYPREILEAFGGFSTSLGRKGSNLLSNEEVLLKRYLKAQNLGDYYDPEICVRHHVPAERLSKRWFYRRSFWQGISTEIMRYVEASPRKPKWRYLGAAFLSALGFVRHPTDSLSIILPANTGSQVLRRCRFYSRLGRIRAQLGIAFGSVDV